jgi:adenylate cyclase
MTEPLTFLDELKRRKVVRVVVVYLAAAFAAIQGADVLFPVLRLPEWALSLVVGLAAVGLPVAAGLAWAFDMTDGGVERTAAEGAAPSPATGWLSLRAMALVVVMLGVGVGAGWLARSASDGPDADTGAKSIAVIPFDNLSSEAGNEFFAVGVQDEILTQLQKISQLHVVSRSSTMRYEPGPERASMPEMGADLGARWIVEGSVARVGEEVRINVQLIEAATDTHLWADVYDGDLSVQGLLAFQGQIAKRIAESLRATIQPEEEARIVAIPTDDVRAYDLYLKGIEHFGRRREADLNAALDYFGQAIALDSTYALAYAGRAMIYTVLPFYSDASVFETNALGKAAAFRALALDSTVAEAYAALGDLVMHGDYDLAGAETELRRAIALKPSFAQAYDWLAEPLLASGRWAEGLEVQRRAVALDPLSVRLNMALGMVLTGSGDPAAGIEQLERTLAMDSTFAGTWSALGDAYQAAGRYEEAAATYRKYAALVSPAATVMADAALAQVDPVARTRALTMLDSFENPSWWMPRFAIAAAYARLGVPDRALDWLESAYDAHDVELVFAFHARDFASLSQEPRFLALAEKVGVPMWADAR